MAMTGRYQVRTAVWVLTLAMLLGSGAVAAAPRTLYWRALDVTAHLDQDGRLRVRERHTMVFDGDWNGGERRFRLGRGQTLQLTGLTRIDSATRALVPLRTGKLAAVDEYRWVDRQTLRWRSRLPSDPSFHNAELVYDIEYVLSDILLVRDSGYTLDHDFAFPDRPGPIQRFTLVFDWDPAWRSSSSFSGNLVRQNLRPGQGVIVTLPLAYVGAGAPASVTLPVAPWWRYFLFGTLIGFVVWRGWLWHRHERRLERYAPLVPLAKIDEYWLAEHVFKVAPEVVGAAWDKRTAAPEVAALLARMTAEGKLASEVRHAGFRWWGHDTLHLKLLHDRALLASYERALVDALFFDGDTTDTDRIRTHYHNAGFDPARKIRAALDQRIKTVAQKGERLPHPRARLTLALLASAAAPVVVGALQQPFADEAETTVALMTAVIVFGIWLVSRIRALFYENYIERVAWVSAGMLAGTFVPLAVLGYVLVTNVLGLNLWLLVGLTVLAAAACNSLFNGMYTRDSLEFNLFRKRLASARRYFMRELRRSSPRLKDAWFPYLLAFGLGTNVDRWFRAYGGTNMQAGDFGGGGGSNSGAANSWTGGGGTFGGAGASGSWAAAVAGVASGVAAASSNGGSSGGGGGGGSSGGGGGGGW